MMLAVWSLVDDGEVIARGTYNLGRTRSPLRLIDPYDTALSVANSLEAALIAYLPAEQLTHFAPDPDQPLLFEEERPPLS